jgi:inner membrane protein
MYLFGHIGITCAVVRKAWPQADLRTVAIASILPDILDKPIAVATNGAFGDGSRLFAHTGIFMVLFLALLRWGLRTNGAILAAIAFHNVLDRAWAKPREIFFWPWLGPFPFFNIPMATRWQQNFLKPYNLIGEAVGLMLILYWMKKQSLFSANRIYEFIRTGSYPSKQPKPGR